MRFAYAVCVFASFDGHVSSPTSLSAAQLVCNHEHHRSPKPSLAQQRCKFQRVFGKRDHDEAPTA